MASIRGKTQENNTATLPRPLLSIKSSFVFIRIYTFCPKKIRHPPLDLVQDREVIMKNENGLQQEHTPMDSLVASR